MSPDVRPPHVLTIADLRRLARRRLPRIVFDYIDGAAEDELTMRRNLTAFEEVVWRPRSAVATAGWQLGTTLLGTPIAMPLLLAPVGSTRLFHTRGEEAAARAAGAAGIPYVLSTLAGCALEDVKAEASGPVWYQVYLLGGRDVAASAIARAKAAGYAALVMTIDTPVTGLRTRDLRNGSRELLGSGTGSMLPFLPQFLTRPGWLARTVADGGLMRFPNVVLPGTGPMRYQDVAPALERTMVTWDDLAWVRDLWGGPIVVKGVHTADDARQAIDRGASAVVVSNHGGRQLDGVAATLQVLPEVIEAVGSRVEVLLDGGIRTGADIAKALCLGARAVLVGRPYAWGLGAAGEAGVARAIEIFGSDLVRTLALLGCNTVQELNRDLLRLPAHWNCA